MHRFSDHDESLDNAGENDLPRIAQEMLHINADDRLLNLSTGWGTLELYLGSQFPLFITTVSPSQEQAQHAYDLMERAGISERVQIETCDFRDLPPQEQFTKLVCLEALDWVGQKNLGDFFQRCADVLVPGGTALIYCTTSPSAFTGSWSQYLGETLHYHLYTLTTICPGRDTALFATLNDYLDEIHRAGLEVDLIENISLDASMTYARWFENWDQARHIIHMRYGEDVYRQWELYLAWSSSILLRGGLSKHSLLLRKPIR
ncbi:S-adenosyl-L-methionine-dependent methyltransferase [Dimargaris cristalligena]|uniref:sphingolipid C(9)-methyltransferase n=1 Tax=Dimargaris cristalligena TaxID=215637 RepID=A0A4V1J5B7_9FUNG|nr:S-adenosyl-L-methionine-dependent methyltransferase [Dimargaris cristalligena]|eukprot:RKP38499.1 S-adenosyl-L-methionine-dependent methyltransferase [Dimargaris cristalligena]